MKHTLLALALFTTPVQANELFLDCEDYDLYWNKYNNYISFTDTRDLIYTPTYYWINPDWLVVDRVDGSNKHRWEFNRNNGWLTYKYYLNSYNSTPTHSTVYTCTRLQEPQAEQ